MIKPVCVTLLAAFGLLAAAVAACSGSVGSPGAADAGAENTTPCATTCAHLEQLCGSTGGDFPYELSGLAATRAFVLTRLSRIFWEALRLRYRRWAKTAGLGELAAHAETGAVTGVHRAPVRASTCTCTSTSRASTASTSRKGTTCASCPPPRRHRPSCSPSSSASSRASPS